MSATDIVINLKTAGDQVVIGALRQVGSAAVNFLGEAAGLALNFAKESFAGAIEAQKGMDKLSASITRLGDNTPVTMDAALGLADQFKNLVGGSDDVVLAMTNVGLRFNQIGKETFPRFIESSADLAATLGIDGPRAAEILGKTLQDFSTDGAGALGRLKAAGVALTDQQEEQIKKMIEAGDVAGAQKVLLDALAETTGGAAAAAAGTFAGQMAIFQETVADAGEGVAMSLLPALTQLAGEVLPQLTPVLTAVAAAASAFITGQFVPALMGAVQFVKDNWPVIQSTIEAVMTFVQGLIASVMPQITANMGEALTQITEFWQAHGDQIIQIVTVAFALIATTVTTALTLLTGIITVALQLINGDWEGAWTTIQDTFTTIMDSILGIAGTSLDEFLQTWSEVLGQLWTIIQLGVQKAYDTVVGFVVMFKDVGLDIMRGLSDGLNEGIGWVKDAAISAVQGAIDAAKHLLGIHSPSTVFASIGENTMAGFAQGIDSAAYMPTNAAVGAAGSVVMNVGGISINGAGNPASVAAAVAAELNRLGRSTDNRLRTR